MHSKSDKAVRFSEKKGGFNYFTASSGFSSVSGVSCQSQMLTAYIIIINFECSANLWMGNHSKNSEKWFFCKRLRLYKYVHQLIYRRICFKRMHKKYFRVVVGITVKSDFFLAGFHKSNIIERHLILKFNEFPILFAAISEFFTKYQ